jgi:hypothetical protein
VSKISSAFAVHRSAFTVHLSPSHPVQVESQALLVIDNEPIRRQVEVELQSVRAAIDRCEQEIVRHETLDLPEFRQWMAVQCSDLLNERRLIEEKIWGLRARLSTVRGLTQHGIRNEAEAFFWFHEIQKETVAVPPYVRRAWEEVTIGPPGRQTAHGVETGRFDDRLDDERTDGRSVDGAGEEGAALLEDDRSRSDPSERGESAKHKSLYRKIARLLHPDMAGALTKQELQLWYQAQRAYEEKDVVALETILARCDRVGTKSRTLSELRGLVMQAISRLANLRRSIDGLAALPSWRFLLLDSAEIKTRLRNVRRELEGAVRELIREAIVLENELERIGRRADQWLLRRKGAGAQLGLGL